MTTPEVLERSVTLEKEIEQIEDSIQSNAAAISGEAEGNNVFGHSHMFMLLKHESEGFAIGVC